MLDIKGKEIIITRGNVLPITITAGNLLDNSDYEFKAGDVLRFKIFDPKNVDIVYLQKDFAIEENTKSKTIIMTAKEMKIGELISKHTTYWWEVDLNPDTDYEQTLIGYEISNPAVLTLLPEAGDKKEGGEA